MTEFTRGNTVVLFQVDTISSNLIRILLLLANGNFNLNKLVLVIRYFAVINDMTKSMA